ncbi:MAG: MATE family efflux transporter [Sphaerochaeta sp.]|jgi:putative MATE family efflux protein|nr:MATE family efflux transporter [Sphaerochaeta sp.]MCH3919615.1 MATE family efflux transporter [Sphaerochaeta sp.]MCI2044852.1 MATE family efflux transporter [Sphaerochaeta sp.]MCI2075911.1 MATE family efflux transporter [Sphaerochaeta sp.]MCI2097513.1 MATE family efflux transporter [Sphaerochaeta sp.]
MAVDSTFSRKMASIAIPVVLQNLLVNSLTFVDTLMIGQLGSEAIAAVGLANQISFLINLFYFGTCTGASIFIAQFYGARNHKGIQNVMALGLLTCFIGSVVFTILAMAAPKAVMHIFTQDPVVVEMGSTYLFFIGPSFLCLAFVQIHAVGLRTTGRADLPLKTSLVSLGTDVVLNYLLIFGIGPFPQLGVKGAAIATLISRILEMVLMFRFTYPDKSPCAIQSAEAFRFSRTFLSKVIPTCIPVICNEFFWALGMSTYKVAYSRLGMDTIAAVNVNESVSNMFFTVMFGVASSALVMIGQKIGEKMYDEARVYCRRFSLIAVLAGAVMGGLQALCAPLFVGMFNVDGAVAQAARYCLYVSSAVFPLRSYDTTLIVGILRSGGDTRFSMLNELSAVWLIGIPMAFLGSVFFAWPIWWVYLLVSLEEVAKGLVGFFRVKSGKWLNDLSQTA